MAEQDGKQLVGICGLYCGACPGYLAYRENDVEELNRISQRVGIPVGEVRCNGCLSDRVLPQCVDCRHGFRGCAEDKGVTWCFQCPEMPCQRLRDFLDIHVVNGISHHAHVIDNLQYMKENGVEKWVKKQEEASCCPECGKKVYWFGRECPQCHTEIRRSRIEPGPSDT